MRRFVAATRSSTLLVIVALAFNSGLAGAQDVSNRPNESWKWARVTYLSGESIYLDAGSNAGLQEKSSLEVWRQNALVATLEIQFVSSSRSAAKLVTGAGIVVGDSARYRASAGINAATRAPSGDAPGADSTSSSTARAAVTASRRASRSARTLSGRVGARYLMLRTGSGSSGSITQPALDLRLEGHRLDGTPLGVAIDARAHRQRSAAGRATASNRVYQLSLEYQTEGPLATRVVAGRQLSSALSPLGFFDGVSLDVDRTHWRVGALGGTQPDFANFQPSAAIREAGAWVQWHTAPGSHVIFQSTLGGVGSYEADGVNREFALLSTHLITRVVSVFATQEVDVNRGWKKDAELGRAITPTSTFASVRVALHRTLSLNGGYDNRRNVRLYRDFLTPDVSFDDAIRRGYWGGVSLSVPHLYASIDTRYSDGETVGRSQSNTASLSLSRLTPLGLGLRARVTSYQGPVIAGSLSSASVEANPWGVFRLEATMGQRRDRRNQDPLLNRTEWLGLDFDAAIGRSWYLMASTYREIGDTDRLLQQYFGLSWRY